jgi:hypothetical protein
VELQGPYDTSFNFYALFPPAMIDVDERCLSMSAFAKMLVSVCSPIPLTTI